MKSIVQTRTSGSTRLEHSLRRRAPWMKDKKDHSSDYTNRGTEKRLHTGLCSPSASGFDHSAEPKKKRRRILQTTWYSMRLHPHYIYCSQTESRILANLLNSFVREESQEEPNAKADVTKYKQHADTVEQHDPAVLESLVCGGKSSHEGGSSNFAFRFAERSKH